MEPPETLAALARALRAGERSPREAVERALARIEARNGALNAYLSVQADAALARAAALEDAAERGPLHGVPVAVKDLVDVAGVPTTAASQILRGRVAARDATVVTRLQAAGAIVLGKLNTHEFAYGAMTTSRHFGPARNPWDRSRVTGGSSGGSGAAAAAGLAAGTLGSDTAGSIRIPAAFCGVSGIRPSTGLVPCRGVFPLSWSFDTVGPLARTAEDCALLLEAIAGHDPQDGTSARVPGGRYAEALGEGGRGLRIGVVRPFFERGVDPRVAEVAERALAGLREAGAVLADAEPPLLEEAAAVQQAIQFPEATQLHLPWLRERLGDYGADVRGRLLAGLYWPPTVYVQAQRLRRVIADGLRRVFDDVDLLAQPSMPVVAPRLLESGGIAVEGLPELEGLEGGARDDLIRRAIIRYTAPWSLAAVPAASVPCGFVDGLPVGLTLVGPRFAEARVLRAAHAFQQVTGWHELSPPVR